MKNLACSFIVHDNPFIGRHTIYCYAALISRCNYFLLVADLFSLVSEQFSGRAKPQRSIFRNLARPSVSRVRFAFLASPIFFGCLRPGRALCPHVTPVPTRATLFLRSIVSSLFFSVGWAHLRLCGT